MQQHLGKTAAIFGGLIVLGYLLAVYWSSEPAPFNVVEQAKQNAEQAQESMVPGYVTSTALIEVSETLLNKPGGYLSNDKMPPSVLMDNMPAWEYGALEMARDLALSMRKDFSRSQSQSTEHPALKKAQPQFNISSTAWIWPSAEGEYQVGIEQLKLYRAQIADPQDRESQLVKRSRETFR